MPTFDNFEQIEAWQTARLLTRSVYEASGQIPFRRDFALRDQIRRACVSVMSNIAEGFERSGTAEFIQYLSQAKGSAGEVRSLLYVASDQEYREPATFACLVGLSRQAARQIGALMLYLRRSGTRGWKFGNPTRESRLPAP